MGTLFVTNWKVRCWLYLKIDPLFRSLLNFCQMQFSSLYVLRYCGVAVHCMGSNMLTRKLLFSHKKATFCGNPYLFIFCCLRSAKHNDFRFQLIKVIEYLSDSWKLCLLVHVELPFRELCFVQAWKFSLMSAISVFFL